MAITSLYQGTFQKSKLFLFPATGVRRSRFTPAMSTFLEWKDHLTVHDQKLTTVMSGQIDDPEYKRYEQHILLASQLFEKLHYINDKTVAYVFNFESYAADWKQFLAGKYSLLSGDLKAAIEQYHPSQSPEREYMHSFLYPDQYFELYASLLWDPPEQAGGLQLLRTVGELCNQYNPEQEIFKVIPNDQSVSTNISLFGKPT